MIGPLVPTPPTSTALRKAVGADIRSKLTNGHATVGATEVDVALRDGCHANLVEGPSKEGREGAAEGNRPVACGTPYSNAHLRTGRAVSPEEAGSPEPS